MVSPLRAASRAQATPQATVRPEPAREEVEAAARDLVEHGFQSRVERRTWQSAWLGTRWVPATPEDTAQALLERKELRIQDATGRAARVASPSDLVELAAFQARDRVERLPSPQLAAALQVLGTNGLLAPSPYEGYNQLLHDPGHPAEPVTFTRGKSTLTLDSPEAALTAGYLVGFGDGQGVDARARALKELAGLGYELELVDRYAELLVPHHPAELPLVRAGLEVTRVPTAGLGGPDALERAQGALQDFEAARAALGDELNSGWGPVRALLEARPGEPDLAAQAGSLYRDLRGRQSETESAQLFEACSSARTEQESLPSAAGPMLRLTAAAPPGTTGLKDLYQAARQEPEALPWMERFLQLTGSPGPSLALSRSPEREQAADALRALAPLGAADPADPCPARAALLVQAAVEAGRLEGDRGSLGRLLSRATASEDYAFLCDRVPEAGCEAYLRLLDRLEARETLGEVWAALDSQPRGHLDRLESWTSLEAALRGHSLQTGDSARMAATLVARLAPERLASCREALKTARPEDLARILSTAVEGTGAEGALTPLRPQFFAHWLGEAAFTYPVEAEMAQEAARGALAGRAPRPGLAAAGQAASQQLSRASDRLSVLSRCLQERAALAEAAPDRQAVAGMKGLMEGAPSPWAGVRVGQACLSALSEVDSAGALTLLSAGRAALAELEEPDPTLVQALLRGLEATAAAEGDSGVVARFLQGLAGKPLPEVLKGLEQLEQMYRDGMVQVVGGQEPEGGRVQETDDHVVVGGVVVPRREEGGSTE